MEYTLTWTVVTEVQGDKKVIKDVFGYKGNGEEYEGFTLGETVRTRQETLAPPLPAGSVGVITCLLDPVTNQNFVFVSFGEGLNVKLARFGYGKLINLTEQLTVPEAGSVS